MAKAINEIIGNHGAKELRGEFNDMLNAGCADFDSVEELLMGYGLEMDYLEQLLF